MKNVQIYLICLGVLLFSFGKVGAQQVLASAGDFLKNTSGSLSFTLGELVIDTKTNTNGTLTQGFQQTKLTVTAIKELPGNNFHIVAYPNPTTNVLFLKSETGSSIKFTYSLFDANGKLLIKNSTKLSEAEISFESMVPAIYYLKVTSDGNETQTFKIIKQ